MSEAITNALSVIQKNLVASDPKLNSTSDSITWSKVTKFDLFAIIPVLVLLSIYLFLTPKQFMRVNITQVLGFDCYLVIAYILWSSITDYPNVTCDLKNRVLQISSGSALRSRIPFFKTRIVKFDEIQVVYIKRMARGGFFSRFVFDLSEYCVIMETTELKQFRLQTYLNKEAALAVCDLLMEAKK